MLAATTVSQKRSSKQVLFDTNSRFIAPNYYL